MTQNNNIVTPPHLRAQRSTQDTLTTLPVTPYKYWGLVIMYTHDTSQLPEYWSHHFCAAKQLSVGAAEQLSVGAGWAGMVWNDVRNAHASTV